MDSIGKTAAKTLAGLVRAATAPKTTYATGTVSKVEQDGTVWVSIDGSESPTPTLAVVSAKEGDAVEVRVQDGEATVTANHTSPVTDDSAAMEAREIAAGVEGVATEAAAVANATNQHFWADSNGVHVATVEGEATDGPNLLANANGILLRDDSANMAAFTPSAVSFFDGQGNQASNVVASFGASGAVIGTEGSSQVLYDQDSMQFVLPVTPQGSSEQFDMGFGLMANENYGMLDANSSFVMRADGMFALSNSSTLFPETYSFSYNGNTTLNLGFIDIESSTNRINRSTLAEDVGTASISLNSEMDTQARPAGVHVKSRLNGSGCELSVTPESVSVDGYEVTTSKNARFGQGAGLYGSTKDSSNLYHRFMFTEVPNIRHDTSPDGTNWTTEGYWVKEHRSGDTMTVSINTGGFVTSSTAQIRIAVPLDKPCPSGMTASVTAKGSWTVRSIGGYSHGSSASAGVTPSSVTATVRAGWIDIAATMSSTTGGTNNTPVGVAVSGLVLEFE